jgi:hypothetical protein
MNDASGITVMALSAKAALTPEKKANRNTAADVIAAQPFRLTPEFSM